MKGGPGKDNESRSLQESSVAIWPGYSGRQLTRPDCTGECSTRVLQCKVVTTEASRPPFGAAVQSCLPDVSNRWPSVHAAALQIVQAKRYSREMRACGNPTLGLCLPEDDH